MKTMIINPEKSLLVEANAKLSGKQVIGYYVHDPLIGDVIMEEISLKKTRILLSTLKFVHESSSL